MVQGIGSYLLPICTCLYALDDVIVWNAMFIYHIYIPVVARDSFSEHGSFYYVFTWLMRKMLDDSRYGPHGGKRHPLGGGWYT